MKNRLTIIAGVVTALCLAFASAKAQANEPAIKILPSTQKGIFKVLYAYASDQPVTVKFFNEEGLIETDNINPKEFQRGFFKKYDVRNIESGSFWVEVAGPTHAATYKMIESKNGTYIPVLEKTTYSHSLAVVNN